MRGISATALENFRKAWKPLRTIPQALNNFAYLLAEHANRPDEALKYAEKAVRESARTTADYVDTLGWILYRKGLYQQAVHHLERAATGGNPVAKYHLAMAYAKAGDRKRGQIALLNAKKENPNLPEARMAATVFAEVR